jgi:penicillin-binding protein 1A
MELVSSYVPFANGGIAVAPHVIERVRTAGGKLIYRARNPGLGRVIDERTAAMMNQMMQETLNIGTARKADLAGWPAAGKTGTSQDFRDAWFVGYTGHLVAGVWLGNDDNSPTKKLTGGGMPVDIWSRFMSAAHRGLPLADGPGLAGPTIDPARAPAAPAAPAPSLAAPLTPMAAAPMGREDDMRPVMPLTPLAPAKPPAVAVAPLPQPQPRASAPAPRPPQPTAVRPQTAPPPVRPALVSPAPAPSMRSAQVAAAPVPPGDIPRPPGAIGVQPARPHKPNGSNMDGFILDNVFGRR